MTPLQQKIRDEFREKFGAPVGDGATVKLTPDSDTMLISESELQTFLSKIPALVIEEAERIAGRRMVKIGENATAMKELGLSLDQIKLHNAEADGYNKRTEEVLQALSTLK